MSDPDIKGLVERLRNCRDVEPDIKMALTLCEVAADALERLSTPPAVPATPVAWHDAAEIPNVDLRGMDEFIVAVKNGKSGKVHTFAAHYLNKFPVEVYDTPCKNCDNSCEDGDGCPLTGWHTLVGDNHYDSGCYYALDLRDGSEIVGWTEVPIYAAPVPAHSDVRSATIEECAKVADTGMLVEPDGGSPNQDEIDTAERIAERIRALSTTAQSGDQKSEI